MGNACNRTAAHHERHEHLPHTVSAGTPLRPPGQWLPNSVALPSVVPTPAVGTERHTAVCKRRRRVGAAAPAPNAAAFVSVLAPTTTNCAFHLASTTHRVGATEHTPSPQQTRSPSRGRPNASGCLRVIHRIAIDDCPDMESVSSRTTAACSTVDGGHDDDEGLTTTPPPPRGRFASDDVRQHDVAEDAPSAKHAAPEFASSVHTTPMQCQGAVDEEAHPHHLVELMAEAHPCDVTL